MDEPTDEPQTPPQTAPQTAPEPASEAQALATVPQPSPKRKGRWGPGERPIGRGKGTPNKITKEIRAFCRDVLSGEEYQESLRRRIAKGKLSPPVEVMLWAYAFGKPPDKVELTIAHDAHRLTDAELEAAAARLLDEMRRIDAEDTAARAVEGEVMQSEAPDAPAERSPARDDLIKH